MTGMARLSCLMWVPWMGRLASLVIALFVSSLLLAEDRPASGKVEQSVTNSLGMKLMYIPEGTFMMGSLKREKGRDGDETPRRVRLTKAFYMGATEVTQRQWQQVMGNNPSEFKGDQLPVENVRWDDVVTFCEKLSEKEGKIYTLPTEAEWEYACRAGSTAPFHYGLIFNGLHANFNDNFLYGRAARRTMRPRYLEKTVSVGSYKPNGFGLYDMHGNVWEWCSDWYGAYDKGSVADPKGPASGSRRVYRGGAWSSDAVSCRSANRDGARPNYRDYLAGFRVVLRSQ